MKILTFFLFFLSFCFFYSFGTVHSSENLSAVMVLLGFATAIFLKAKSAEGFGWAIFLGLLIDSFSAHPWGTFTISIMLGFFLIGFFKSKIIAHTENRISFFLIFLIAFLAFCLFIQLVDFSASLFSKKVFDKTIFSKYVSPFNFSLFLLAGYAYFFATSKIEKILNLTKSEIIVDKTK